MSRNSTLAAALSISTVKLEVLTLPFLSFRKCGTSTLMANLGHLAPMPVKDICSGPGQTLKLAYQQWPNEFAGNLTRSIVDNNTLLRGSKCPRHISDWMIRAFAANFQKTKFIVGIR